MVSDRFLRKDDGEEMRVGLLICDDAVSAACSSVDCEIFAICSLRNGAMSVWSVIVAAVGDIVDDVTTCACTLSVMAGFLLRGAATGTYGFNTSGDNSQLLLRDCGLLGCDVTVRLSLLSLSFSCSLNFRMRAFRCGDFNWLIELLR